MEPRDLRGSMEFKGRLFFAHPGDVIYSKIDVRNGAIGVVSDEMGTVAVSSEYPVYRIKPERAVPDYIKLLFRTSFFRATINSMISGASGRKRVQPSQLEQIEVALPPLSVQRAIVARWRGAQAAVAKANARIARIERETAARFLADLGLTLPERATPPKAFALRWQDLERWSVTFNQLASIGVDISTGKYSVTTLGEIAAVSYGIQKCPANRPGHHARPYLRVANVQRGELDLSEIKYINVPDSEMPSLRLDPGDLLFVEGNGSRAELGRCAIWRGEIPDCVHQNHILKVRPDSRSLLPEYAMTWFNSDAGKDHFFRNVKSSSGLGSINSSELRSAPIPLPPLDVQRAIMQRVEAGRAQIAREREAADRLRRETQTEVEEMILGVRPVK